jgi:hypothetical protein
MWELRLAQVDERDFESSAIYPARQLSKIR